MRNVVAPAISVNASPADLRAMASAIWNAESFGFLPGGIPISLDSVLPRHLGSGPWKYHSMLGYTSVGAGCSIVPARFNCPPEITTHYLQCAL